MTTEWIHPFAYSTIKRDLEAVKAISHADERYEVLISEDLLRPIWEQVTRRHKTEGGYTIPSDERPFLLPAIVEPRVETPFLQPPLESSGDPEMAEILAQAHAIAQLLTCFYWIVENKGSDAVNRSKPRVDKARLLAEAAERIEAVGDDLRDETQLISLRVKEHPQFEFPVHWGMYSANELRRIALYLRSVATNRDAWVNLVLKRDPDALSVRVNKFVSLPGRNPRRSQARHSSNKEAWVAAEISKCFVKIFGQRLEGLAASSASLLLGSEISREAVRSARRGMSAIP